MLSGDLADFVIRSPLGVVACVATFGNAGGLLRIEPVDECLTTLPMPLRQFVGVFLVSLVMPINRVLERVCVRIVRLIELLRDRSFRPTTVGDGALQLPNAAGNLLL